MDQAAPEAQPLYARQKKIHAREIEGTWNSLRRVAVVALLGLYYLLPWIPWAGRQAVLFDLPARRFHIFGLTLWPQDFIYLAWLLIMAALLLFAVTAVAGRIWCGYACPQTVWTEIFVWMERITEGPFNRRVKLDRGPWNAEKILRKGAKQFLWIGFAFWTGLTFVGYFTPIVDLTARMATLAWGPWETFWVFFYGLATYGNAGFLREQVCKYMCPYARFQGAMFDRDTLIVTYDSQRGEPRGGRSRAAKPKELGDCIDCQQCVQVCPTGIDIRKGLQYECIACAACIDACDSVMDRMGYERNLIRYSTQRAMEGEPTRVLRPRTIIYFSLLGLLFTTFIWSLTTRNPVHLDVIRDRNTPYREIRGGLVENVYTLRVINKGHEDREYVLEVAGLEDARVETDPPVIRARAGALTSVTARVQADPDRLTAARSPIELIVRPRDDDDDDDEHDDDHDGGADGDRGASHETTFLGPPPAAR